MFVSGFLGSQRSLSAVTSLSVLGESFPSSVGETMFGTLESMWSWGPREASSPGARVPTCSSREAGLPEKPPEAGSLSWTCGPVVGSVAEGLPSLPRVVSGKSLG